MPEPARASRGRAPTAEQEALHAWFAEQERDPTRALDEGARQIISIVSTLFTVLFGILAFAANPTPAYLARPDVRLLGALGVLGSLFALLAALAVVLPSAYRYSSASQTQREAVYATVLRRKAWGLRVALVCFAAGSVGFAGLFLAVLFG